MQYLYMYLASIIVWMLTVWYNWIYLLLPPYYDNLHWMEPAQVAESGQQLPGANLKQASKWSSVIMERYLDKIIFILERADSRKQVRQIKMIDDLVS